MSSFYVSVFAVEEAKDLHPNRKLREGRRLLAALNISGVYKSMFMAPLGYLREMIAMTGEVN